MSPLQGSDVLVHRTAGSDPPTVREGIILEGWAEGFMIGSLVVMAGITIANMRKGVLLHKLILLELVIGGWQSFNIFWQQPTYGWWLSSAAVGLHMSTQLHNIIAWMKIKPFLTRRSSQLFIGTVILVQPYWVLEIYATFAYFNNFNDWLFLKTRPIETIFRDPWWVAACAKLLWVLKGYYDLKLREVVVISPRFSVMLVAMALSIAFVILDILSVTEVFSDALPIGVNPFWKLALVFKCLTDTVILDDFKTALDRLWAFKRDSLGGNSPLIDREHYSASSNGKRSTSREHSDRVSPHSSLENNLNIGDFELQPPPTLRV